MRGSLVSLRVVVLLTLDRVKEELEVERFPVVSP